MAAPPAPEPAEHDLDAVSPLVVPFVVFGRGFLRLSAKNTGAHPLLCNAVLTQSASELRSASRALTLGGLLSRARAPVWSLICPAMTCRLIGCSRLSQIACSLVIMPPLVRPARQPRPPFRRPCWSPFDVPSGRSRRSWRPSPRRRRRPAPPSSGRTPPCRAIACRASSAGHTPVGRRTSASHCD